jgi:adenylate kinase
LIGAKQIAFVGGIHGVGKTTTCRAVADQIGVTHLAASELVRAGGGVATSGTKVVSDVPANQVALVAALAAVEHKELILDGHFCVLATDLRIEPVPLNVFAAIDPVALVLVSGQATEIRSRLRDRDGVEYDEEILARFQDAEAAHAVRVATALGRPLLCITADRVSDMSTFVQRALLQTR